MSHAFAYCVYDHLFRLLEGCLQLFGPKERSSWFQKVSKRRHHFGHGESVVNLIYHAKERSDVSYV